MNFLRKQNFFRPFLNEGMTDWGALMVAWYGFVNDAQPKD